MSSWKECKLGDVLELITKGTTPPNGQGFVKLGINYIKSDAINYNGRIDKSKFVQIDLETHEKFKRSQLREFDILFSMAGAYLGKNAIVTSEILPANTNQALAILRLNQTLAIPRYVSYYLSQNEIVDFVNNMSGQSAQPNINFQEISSIPLLLPPPEEQKAIAEVLSSLDDKIDLLHRQNQTLESLAQTLFRQWFIEEAKEEWEEIKLGDFVDCITGYSYKSDDLNDSKNALVTLKNFARDGSFRLDGFKEFTGTKYKDSQIVKHGDLVVSHTDITQEADIIGNPVLVVDMGRYDNLIITMDLMKVESKVDWLSKEFLYYLFRTEDFKFHCLGNSNGTTVLHMSRKTIPEYKTKIPSIKRIEEFTKDVKEILQKQYVNILQIQTLENLRDTLLPKLLSGEVRVYI